jgi:hypothetical protein
MTIDCARELRRISAAPLCPGTLNVVLDGPLRLSRQSSFEFDRGRRRLWRAALNGTDVWAYRWDEAPLHVLEIVSTVHLRTSLSLEDGDAVTVQIAPESIRPLGPCSRILWAALWYGRRASFYRTGNYFTFASRLIHLTWLVKQHIYRLRPSR